LSDPELAMRIAIECLKDTGLNDLDIDNQITAWMKKHNCNGDWWDMPQEKIERVARSFQKAFERRYQPAGRDAA
jgi:hypothetical protein